MTTSAAPGSEAVACVTVTYNSAGVMEDFLDSLHSQVDVAFHLYAVDNASTDDSCELLESSEISNKTTLIRNPTNDGVARGNNLGIRPALEDGYSWILIVNNDTIFGPTAIADLLREAHETGARVISPFIEAVEPAGSAWYVGGTISMWRAARPYHQDIHRDIAQLDPTPRDVAYAPTCVLLVHRSVFDEVGLMDEAFFVYGDDVDFAIRVVRAGIPYVVTGGARFIHKINGTTGSPTGPFRARWGTRNWIYCARKHCAPLQLIVGVLYVLIWSTARFAARRETFEAYRTRLAAILEGLRSPLQDDVPRVEGAAT